MRLRWLVIVLLLAGCRTVPLYTPEVQVRPESVGYGGQFNVKLYGAAIGHYRFMGALEGTDGLWTVRVEPVTLGFWGQGGQFTARTGDVVPLGPDPSVLVQFVEIRPTRLKLRAVSVYKVRGE